MGTERDQLIEEHLPLVQQVVLQVAGSFPRYVDRRELARAGAVGLVEAAHRYDASRGVPFDRFAARRIRGAILDSVRSVDWAPRSVRSAARQLESVEQELTNAGSGPPDANAVAQAMGMSTDEVTKVRDRVYRSVVLALDYGVTVAPDEDVSLVDVLADRTQLEPDEELEGRELLGYLRDAVELLPERHRIVVVGYFLEGRTSTEVGELLGVTESRVSQLRSEALTMLREGIEAQYEVEPTIDVRGRVAKRKAVYASAIGEASDWRERIALSA